MKQGNLYAGRQMHFYDGCKRFTVAATVVSLMTGCMVGPNFHSPAAPHTSRYNASPLPSKTVSTPSAGESGKSQYFISDASIPADWWVLFHSPQLNALIQAGLKNSPNLASAKATLRQAQETLYAQIGLLMLPSVSAQAAGERARISGLNFGSESPSSLFNVYNTSVNVSYALDLFGGSRRQIEGYAAQVNYQQYELLGAYLTLTSNIVTTAITMASLEDQIQAVRSLITYQEKQLSIIRKQFQLGGQSGAAVYAQESQLEQTRALLPPLQNNLSKSQHALSVLIGSFPADDTFAAFHLNKLNLPAVLPMSLPSKLVRQRPDIRASESLLHAASAQVGVDTAKLFPQFTLTAAYGYAATSPAGFSANTSTWNYGGQLLQPIFYGGALQAQKRASIAGYDVAFADYQEKVLQAFKNVADTLRALETDARELRAQKRAELAALKSMNITQKQYVLGGVNYLALLDAQEQYQQTVINRIKAQAARYADTAALFQALGGGWWNRQEIKS